MSVGELRKVQAPSEEPSDFDAFWRETGKQTDSAFRGVTVKGEGKKDYQKGFKTEIIVFHTLDDMPVHAWLVKPKDADQVKSLMVAGHGYGNPEEPERPFELKEDCAAIFFCAPGLGMSRLPGISDETPKHVLHGIEDPERYVLRHCAMAIRSSAHAGLELFPSLRRFVYFGVSFGGGLGALALGSDTRFERSVLVVPTFGNHPLRLSLPSCGSGEAVRQRYQKDASILKTLRYFDAASAAKRITHPCLCAPAAFDPAVIPPGQFAVANSIQSDEIQELSGGHFDHPVVHKDWERMFRCAEKHLFSA